MNHLKYNQGGIDYEFSHGKCHCFSHCNVDSFFVNDIEYFVNESNGLLCDITEAMFKNEIYKIEKLDDSYMIFTTSYDEEDGPDLLIKNDVWEFIPSYEIDENGNGYWPIACHKAGEKNNEYDQIYGNFLAEYCENWINQHQQ
jgi:hypothetical protein